MISSFVLTLIAARLVCAFPEGFDATIDLQGRIPLDTDGREVRVKALRAMLVAIMHRRMACGCCPQTVASAPPPLPAQVHAHGGQLLQEGQRLYWVGTSQKQLPFWTSTHINIYESTDLQRWTFRCRRQLPARLPASAACCCCWPVSKVPSAQQWRRLWQHRTMAPAERQPGLPRLPLFHLLQPTPSLRH